MCACGERERPCLKKTKIITKTPNVFNVEYQTMYDHAEKPYSF
jgi:hypothetical protein